MNPTAHVLQHADSPEGPVSESWLYRSEAFAEDLDELTAIAPPLSAPRRISARATGPASTWFGARGKLLAGLR